MEMEAQDILFLDAYDSFTYNIVSLLASSLPLAPTARIVVHSLNDTVAGHDAPLCKVSNDVFSQYLRGFKAVICGPGPGNPLNPDHVGPFTRLWDLPDDDLVPVLGICLGFQSLVARFGGGIRKLRLGQHGIIREIEHQSGELHAADIFYQVPPFKATLYHSLCADIGQDHVSAEEWTSAKWATFTQTPDLIPLAWTTVSHGDHTERIMMGTKHVTKPFWGLQYHPESICTEAVGVKVLQNWFREATEWSEQNGRKSSMAAAQDNNATSGRGALPTAIQSRVRAYLDSRIDDKGVVFADDWLNRHRPELSPVAIQHYEVETLDLPEDLNAVKIMELLGGSGYGSQIMFDASSSRINDPLAKQSIIALDVAKALRFEHVAAPNGRMTMVVPPRDSGCSADKVELQTSKDIKAWDIISQFWSARQQDPGAFEEPRHHKMFKGGFMGYLSYEMGLQTVTPELFKDRRDQHTDLCLAWITHSAVIDHQKRQIHIQAIGDHEKTKEWLRATKQKLLQAFLGQQKGHEAGHTPVSYISHEPRYSKNLTIKTPEADEYEEKVRQCQREISEGNSYELCLTQQTIMTRPRTSPKAHANGHNGVNGHENGHTNGNDNGIQSRTDVTQSTPWQIYKTLRSRQPAPFGSFISLGGATLLSCSPERFLRYDAQGNCSMRPMKGTVRKSKTVSKMEDAERMLRVPKEIAENLMIVDLVRHDLHRVCGYGQVTVPEPFKIEEYATVFTMVTGIDGKLNQYLSDEPQGGGQAAQAPMTGFDVLKSVFPPGSMTGAPKKRSCELLTEIEDGKPRGLYSGVVGYMDITGAGDWSVTIRSMFRYDDETADPEVGETEPREVWHIGAGGAVTILSTPDGEREEMFTKLDGPMGVFRDMA